MGKLTELHSKIKTIFPEAVDFSADKVIQGGIYLLFNELRNEGDWREDICSYSLLIASNSIHEDKNSILPLIDGLRERLGTKEALEAFDGQDVFINVTTGNFQDMLFVYDLKMEFKIYREMDEELEQ
jgi:hypothetical protein